MGKLKDTIFNEIRSDYVINKSDSFLYKYLVEGKMKDKCKGADKAKRDKIIHKAATDLMYNNGYPLKAQKNVERLKSELADYDMVGTDTRKKLVRVNQLEERLAEATAEQAEDKGRGGKHTNTALDLVDQWYTLHGIRSQEDVVSVEQCQKLFDILQKLPKYDNVIIPLQIDKLVGAGVYILGNRRAPGVTRRGSGNCIIAIVIPDADGEEYAIRICDEGYDDVETAFDFFSNTSYKETMEDLSLWNGESPDGIPVVFRKYFESDEDEDDFERFGPVDELTEEDLEETRRIFAEEN